MCHPSTHGVTFAKGGEEDLSNELVAIPVEDAGLEGDLEHAMTLQDLLHTKEDDVALEGK